MRRFLRIVFILVLIVPLFFIWPKGAGAVRTYDQANGTCTDDFSDTSGIHAQSQMNVNTTTDVLQLTKNDGSGLFTAPFYTSGTVLTLAVLPTSIAKWNTVTYDANLPLGTAIKIQFADDDEYLFSDDVFPGNSAGFTASTIDISGLPPFITATNVGAGDHKIGRVVLKITMTTSVTSATPTMDNLVVSWTVKQGDLSATTVNSANWPTPFVDQKGILHQTNSNSQTYAAFRWASDQIEGYATSNPSFIYDDQFIASVKDSADGYDHLYSLNRDTGAADRSYPMRTRGYFSIGQNGTGYQTDMSSDIFTTIDLNDGSAKWSYALADGHGNDNVAIGSDGTIYTVRNQDRGGTINVYAFEPDGDFKWTSDIIDLEAAELFPTFMSQGSNGMLYFGTYDMDNYVYTNKGKLYAFNPATQTVEWQYATGDLIWLTAPIIDSDGTIYVANQAYGTNFAKNIIALNPDGTLKWSHGYGDNTDAGYSELSLRDDGTLIATRIIDYTAGYMYFDTILQSIDTTDGSLISTQDQISTGLGFTDGNNNLYYSAIDEGATAHDFVANFGYYDTALVNKWKVVWPYNDVDGDNLLSYGFYHGNAVGALPFGSIIGDDRGWLYGTFDKYVRDPGYGTVYADSFTQYFGMAPWTLSVNGPTAFEKAGDTINFSVVTTMQETNPLLGGDNKMQIIMDSGEIVPLVYDSKNSDGDTIWTGSYNLPDDSSPGNRTFTIEASQSYMQTDVATHFASATTESGNTGIIQTGSFTIMNELPQTGGD